MEKFKIEDIFGQKHRFVDGKLFMWGELNDGQISKIVGSTKGTVALIRKRSYWNFSNLKPRDPVILSLCTQEFFQKALEKAKRRIEREKKIKVREEKKLQKEKDLQSTN